MSATTLPTKQANHRSTSPRFHFNRGDFVTHIFMIVIVSLSSCCPFCG